MTKRVCLNDTHWMLLNGQPQLVLGGSVVDVPDTFVTFASKLTVLNETAGSLATGGSPASVRNVRTR